MRRIFVVDDDVLRGLPPAVRAAALWELERVFAFVDQFAGEQGIAVDVRQPIDFPAELDFSDAVVRLVNDELLSAHLGAAFRLQLAYVRDGLEAAGVMVEEQSEDRFVADPERLGTASSAKSVSSGFAICLMASFVTLPGAAAAYVEDTEGTSDSIDPNTPAAWPTEAQERFGVYAGRAMAHEARHLLLPSHAASGLGTDSPDLLDDTNYAEFSADDQSEIVSALRSLEADQAGNQLISVFPESVRNDPDAFPF